jgi:hypothetical protein
MDDVYLLWCYKFHKDVVRETEYSPDTIEMFSKFKGTPTAPTPTPTPEPKTEE